jgi:hypothetical protein
MPENSNALEPDSRKCITIKPPLKEKKRKI